MVCWSRRAQRFRPSRSVVPSVSFGESPPDFFLYDDLACYASSLLAGCCRSFHLFSGFMVSEMAFVACRGTGTLFANFTTFFHWRYYDSLAAERLQRYFFWQALSEAQNRKVGKRVKNIF